MIKESQNQRANLTSHPKHRRHIARVVPGVALSDISSTTSVRRTATSRSRCLAVIPLLCLQSDRLSASLEMPVFSFCLIFL
ncbi:unnamed protein product [Rodentolepis nana]|uniref:Uncharacterized protein n=1 Tax=Rodentolepis nana TaxID=102285 RepID=A0A0R3TAV8_RODNA|nr:unnamed protein product [Rodentolepis nana]